MGEFGIGSVIADRYKVLALLGAGGMGAVYLVEDQTSNNRYALKTILPTDVCDHQVKRFEMEAKATALLKHPNLIEIYDFGFIDEKQPYFVMEYCQGQSLSEIIKNAGPLRVEKALDVFITICNALTYAHAQGVVHRDLKPSNVMIKDGDVKVLDFGIAKVFREGTEFNTLTQTGELLGSPYYMSPEQCVGRAVDLRSDVYSLGCMFFEALTGAPPFTGDSPLTTMLKHQSEQPPTLREAALGVNFSSDLENIMSRMLAKNPANRYPDLLRAADDLKHVQRGELLPSFQFAKSADSFHAGYVAIGAGVLLIATVTALFLLQPQVQNTQLHAFAEENAKRKLPAFYMVREKTDRPRTGYYSDLKRGNGRVRNFHFPAIAIGDFGYGDDLFSYKPMLGQWNDVKIPFCVHIRHDPSGLSGFRDDEVSYLVLKGFLVDDKATDAIKNWQELSHLDIDGTGISDVSIANMMGLKKLTSLSINETDVTADGLGLLPLESMKMLNIGYLRGAKSLLPRLRHSQELERLMMDGDQLADNDLKLISQIQHLSYLDIRDNQISDAGIENLSAMKELRQLFLDASGLTPDSVKTLGRMNLGGLAIERCAWTKEEIDRCMLVLKRRNKNLQITMTRGSHNDSRPSLLR